MSKVVARIAFGIALVLCAAVWTLRLGNGVETDLYGLADARQGGVLRQIATGLAGQGRVLLEGDDLDRLKAKAAEIRTAFAQPPRADYRETLAYLDTHKAGLLAPETRALLKAGQTAAVAEGAATKLFGLVPPLFSVKRDPFLLGTDYALALESNLAAGWSLDDGYPVCEQDGTEFLLLTLDLATCDGARIAEFLARAEAQNADADAACKIWCGGPPFHAARTAAQSKREINWLSALSLALVVLFGWLLFRSLRFLPQLLLALGVGFLAAGGALFAVFPKPHVLTFVFGTSLIGLSVDYVYHARAAGDVRKILKPLTFSLLTTVACFAPLLFAEVGVLRQMATFTIAGLVAVYAFVVLFGGAFGTAGRTPARASCGPSSPPAARPPYFWIFFFLVAPFLLPGLSRVRVVEDPKAFYRPEPYLAAGEARLYRVSPVSASRFAFVPGETLQAALEAEEAAGVKGLSAVIPSLARQRENAALVEALVRAEGSNYTAKTKIKMPAARTDAFLDPDELPEGALKQMVRAMHVPGGLVSPLPEGASVAPGVTVLEPRAALEDLFHRLTEATWKLLAVSFGAFLVLLAVCFRGNFIRFAWPVVLALLATAATLGLLRVPVTFFTLLCAFVLMGLGIDYVVFHRGHPGAETKRVVFFAFLTSFAGLGLLAFTKFPVTHAMGVTFAVGLAYAYLFSLPTGGAAREGEPPSAAAQAWHEQGEQSAGRLRLAFMWLVYRFLGKGFMKILCVPVMAFIYPFAKPAKKALRDFYRVLGEFQLSDSRASPFQLFRHLLGFAWSLADKTDACALKKNLPAMRVRDDAGGRAFQACVAARQGAFLISTHVGTIEVLPALAKAGSSRARVPHVHAFQQMGHDAAFTRVFMKRFDATQLTLHAVEDVGVETAVEMQAAIRRGELVLMAGDRVSAGSAKTLAHDFLGRPCRWPKGVFAFAKLMESPVFFVTCVRTGWNAYEVHVQAFKPGDGPVVKDLLDQYVAFLTDEVLEHPAQWYQFYDFFGAGSR